MDNETLVAGCLDHALKVVDTVKGNVVKQSILTVHKVATCMDCAQSNLILTGCEDAVIRLWDTRQGDRAARSVTGTYSAHSQYLTSVRFNSQVENIFLSGSLDGTVKLWDLRNDEMPLANLKTKNTE